ncbi:MAG: hypothetical protein LBC65_03755 [Oscillospiraceae bacterium]|nr:hypothetical protein [Oscillospiraceae bacterium]
MRKKTTVMIAALVLLIAVLCAACTAYSRPVTTVRPPSTAKVTTTPTRAPTASPSASANGGNGGARDPAGSNAP